MKKRLLAMGMAIMMLCTVIAPMCTYAEEPEMSAEFKALLNEDGKLEVNSVKPATEEEGWMLFGDLLWFYYGDDVSIIYDGDTETAEIMYRNEAGEEECHTVDVVFTYDEALVSKAETIMESLPKGEDFGYYFEVSDMELINYWLTRTGNVDKDEMGGGLDNFSSELKSYFKNENYKLFVSNAMGDDQLFLTARMGMAYLMHSGCVYAMNSAIGAKADHIIYVPDNTGDSKEELLAAVQKRVDDYLGSGKLTVTYGGDDIAAMIALYHEEEADKAQAMVDALTPSVDAYTQQINALEEEIMEIQQQIANTGDPDGSLEALYQEKRNLSNALAQEKMDYIMETKYWDYKYIAGSAQDRIDQFTESYTNPEGDNYFLQSAQGGHWFKTTVNEVDYYFVAMKDSSKMLTPTVNTVDTATNVSVATDNSLVPLDTVITVEKLTEGAEYLRLVEVLDVTTNVTVDITLFSDAINKPIKNLDSGKFSVKIPVPTELNGKELIAYYVDADGKITEYAVTVAEGFANFETDHFSIYTIAEKTVKEEIKDDPKPEQKPEDKPEQKPEDKPAQPGMGDEFPVWMWSICLVAGCVVMVHSYNRKHAK